MATSESNLPAGVEWRENPAPAAQALALAEAVASDLRDALARQETAFLLVSGGRSPVAFFDALAARSLEWSRVRVGLVDERWVPETHEDSNAGLVRRHLLRGEASRATFHGLYRPADSLEAAAQRADADAAGWPVADVVVLGMGTDGHTASLFPGAPGLEAALDDEGPRRCVSMWSPQAPHARLSLTRAFLGRAARSYLALEGQAKREVLAAALAGGDPLRWPILAFLRSPLTIHWCPTAREGTPS